MTSGLKRTSEVHSERRVIYRCDATMCNSLSDLGNRGRVYTKLIPKCRRELAVSLKCFLAVCTFSSTFPHNSHDIFHSFPPFFIIFHICFRYQLAPISQTHIT